MIHLRWTSLDINQKTRAEIRCQSTLIMSLRFIALLCLTLCNGAILQDETVSAPPKFGDRIGKLKRNFRVNTTTTTTTTAAPIVSFDGLNDIQRSDDYYSTDDHDNKKFYVLKGGLGDGNDLDNPVKSKDYPDQSSAASQDSFNRKNWNASPPHHDKNFQLQSPSVVQARLEMLTDFFDVPPSPMPSVYSTSSRPTSLSKTGVVLAAKNFIHPTNATLRGPALAIETGLRKEPWVIPVLVLSCLSMLMMATFEIFVLCKTRKTSPNRRHLFLGQMLLLGLFSCAGLSALLTAR